MYVETARSSYAERSASGTTNQPTRSPGATVFENDEVKVTRSPPSSSCSDAGRGALVADEPVRVVLEHVDVVLPAELGDAPAALLAERATARVLEGRDGVEERDVAAARELRLERLRVEPLVVHLERDDLDALPAEELQRAIVGRALDEHAPGSPRELRGDVEDEALQSTRREEDPARVDPVTLAEQLPQRPVPATRAVREDRPTVALERHAGAVREQLGVEAGRRGRASGERDRCHRVEPTSAAPAGAAATVQPHGRPRGRPVRSASFDSVWARRS